MYNLLGLVNNFTKRRILFLLGFPANQPSSLPTKRLLRMLNPMQTTVQANPAHVLFKEEAYTAEMCLDHQSLSLAYHLRYRAYLKAGAIPVNPYEMCTDDYDDQANARTFLIWYEDQAVASVRSFTWSSAFNWQTTPSLDMFPKDIKANLGWRIPLLESNRYVVDPDFQGRKSLNAQMLLFRIQSLGALVDECSYVITAMRPRHIKFYQRFMGFYPISEPKAIDLVRFPIQLLATPISSVEILAQHSKLAQYTENDLYNYRMCLQQ